MDGVQRHKGDGGGAVRVGDELLSLARLHVDLGDDERDVRVHPPRRRVVDHDRPGLLQYVGAGGWGEGGVTTRTTANTRNM